MKIEPDPPAITQKSLPERQSLEPSRRNPGRDLHAIGKLLDRRERKRLWRGLRQLSWPSDDNAAQGRVTLQHQQSWRRVVLSNFPRGGIRHANLATGGL